jgi:hypothetical protein
MFCAATAKTESRNLLNLPTRVAFTQIKIPNSELRESVMILRNDKNVNFRFQLPDTIQLGSMKQPVSFDANTRLIERGDVVVVDAGVAGTGQDLGVRLSVQDTFSDSYSVDGRVSCSVPRTRRIAETYCWRDSYGRRHCETRWITETLLCSWLSRYHNSLF